MVFKKKNNSKNRRKLKRAHLQWLDPSLVTQRVLRNVKLEDEAMTTTSVPTVKKFYSSDSFIYYLLKTVNIKNFYKQSFI